MVSPPLKSGAQRAHLRILPGIAAVVAVAVLSAAALTAASLQTARASLRLQVTVGQPPVTSVDGGTGVVTPETTTTQPATTQPATTTQPTTTQPATTQPQLSPVQGSTTTTTSLGPGPVSASSTIPGSPTTPNGVVPIVAGAATSTTLVSSAQPSAAPTDQTVTSLPSESGPTTLGPTPAIPATPATPATPTSAPTTTASAPARTPTELRAIIEKVLGASTSNARSVFMTIDGAGTVVDLDADVARAPASTQKIYVAAAILAALGRDHRYVTEVRSSAIVNDGVVETLFLRASGDPSLSSTQLESLAAAVAASGVREVPGGLAIDDSRFDAARRVDVWKPSFTPGEVGVLNAFSVDGNHRNETDAGLANLSRFRSALRKRGVVVGAGDRRASIGNGGPVLASVQSAPLAELVRTMVKRSDNTYAELFTKELGARRGVGSTASGVAAIASYMVSLGVAAPVVQIDGSGLSLQNRSTARQQVAFFRKASDTLGGSFLEAMPVACVDGTLKNRMCATAAAKRARAKSGAIDFVVGLTGTTETANGKRVTFSFLLNSVKSSASARAAIDRAVAAASAATI